MVFKAYDDEDPDSAKQALASPFIRHMDVEYAILARDLPLPKGVSGAPKANVIENAAPSYKSPNSGGGGQPAPDYSAGDEEDEEGGLC